MQYRGITLMLTQDVFNGMLINVIKVNALGQVHTTWSSSAPTGMGCWPITDTHLHTWVEWGTVNVKCVLPKNTTQWFQWWLNLDCSSPAHQPLGHYTSIHWSVHLYTPVFQMCITAMINHIFIPVCIISIIWYNQKDPEEDRTCTY